MDKCAFCAGALPREAFKCADCDTFYCSESCGVQDAEKHIPICMDEDDRVVEIAPVPDEPDLVSDRNIFVSFKFDDSFQTKAESVKQIVVRRNERVPIFRPWIGTFKNLTNLAIEKGNAPTLPVEIGDLSALLHFTADSCGLKYLPTSVNGWKKIRTVTLNNNFLESLPDEIGAWSELTQFDARFNKLRTLPDSIGAWTKLKEFYVAGNELTTLPDSIGGWKMAWKVDLSGNKFESIPDEVGNWSLVRLHNNRIKYVPFDMVTKMSHYRENAPNPFHSNPLDLQPELTKLETWKEVKIYLVGGERMRRNLAAEEGATLLRKAASKDVVNVILNILKKEESEPLLAKLEAAIGGEDIGFAAEIAALSTSADGLRQILAGLQSGWISRGKYANSVARLKVVIDTISFNLDAHRGMFRYKTAEEKALAKEVLETARRLAGREL